MDRATSASSARAATRGSPGRAGVARGLVALLAALATTLPETGAAREPSPGAETVMNEVTLPASRWTGEYLAEVAAAMKPGDVGRTTVDYTYRYELGPAGDVIVSCGVLVTIGVGLAEWTHRGLRAHADSEWDRFVAELERHERGHVAIARRVFAGAAERCLGETPDGCKAALEAVMEREKKDQAAYDRETQHGLRTGAALAGRVDRRPAR